VRIAPSCSTDGFENQTAFEHSADVDLAGMITQKTLAEDKPLASHAHLFSVNSLCFTSQ
jgi:hypothetical protein